MKENNKMKTEVNMKGPKGPHAILTNLIYTKQEVC